MQRIISFGFFLTILILGSGLLAQDVKFPGIDASPADIATLRTDDGVLARVVYSRPQKKGREIFGGIVPFDQVWRTGANEATEITFFQDVKLGDVMVSAGTYTLFTVPGEEEWGIMLNSDLNQWGAYRADMDHTVARTSGVVTQMDQEVEAFAITFREVEGGHHMVLAWDKTMVEVPIMAQ